MLRYLSDNYQVFLMLLLLLATGIYYPAASYALIPVIVVLFTRKEMLMEIIIGFLFILILDDNIHNELFSFAVLAKEIYIVTLAVLFFLYSGRYHPFNTLFLWFVPFLIAGFTSAILFSPDFYSGLEKGLSYLLLLLLIPNYITRLFREKKERIFKDFFYFVILIFALGILIRFVDREFVSIRGRFCGLFGNPNGLGIFCTVTFVLFELLNECFPRLFSRPEKFLFYVLLFVSLILTASRTAYLSFAVFFIFRWMHRVSPIVSFALLLVIFAGYEFIFINLIDVIGFFGLEHYFRLQTLSEGGGRFIAWKFAWDEVNKVFFLGRGFNYDVFFFRSHYMKLVRMGHEGLVHNSFLSVWLNSGITGLMLFVSAIVGLFIKASRNSRLAVPVIFTVITSSFFESWLIASLNPFTIIFWIILTVLTSEEFHAGKQKIPVSV